MPLHSGVLAGILAVVGNARLLRRAVELLGLAVREFFLPQYETRLFPGSRPVLVIAHPLDDRIPFVPAQVRTYLGFIGAWVEGLGALHLCFGEQALAEMAGSIEDLCHLYRAAGSVYRRCQTTTRRVPGPWLSPHFLLIRLFDPHLHCIPSLHVLIACYNYLRLRRSFRTVAKPRNRAESESLASPASEAYRSALRIIRATLLVKQHSVADIGPSLFMLSELFPDYDRPEVQRFASDLAEGFVELSSGRRAELREAVLRDYRSLNALRARRPSVEIEELVIGYVRSRSLGLAGSPQG